MKNGLRLLAFMLALFCFMTCGIAEEEDISQEENHKLYVMTKLLYGRIRPGKRYSALCEFEIGTPLEPTGRISSDRCWVEIKTAEGELVWCNAEYLTERMDIFHVFSLNDEAIKIRKHLGAGKVTGYARREKIIEITQVVLGYGRCSKGWVDLSYFIEDCE